MLRGDLVFLRAPEESDWGVLHRLRNDVAAQVSLLSAPRGNTMERVRNWVSQLSADAGSLFYVIARAHDGDATGREAVGYIQIVQMNHLHGHGELGICLAEDARGHGYGAAAIGLLLEHARRVFGLRKVTLRVRRDNAKALALYRRASFREVGYLEAHHLHDGVHHDVVIMEKFLH